MSLGALPLFGLHSVGMATDYNGVDNIMIKGARL